MLSELGCISSYDKIAKHHSVICLTGRFNHVGLYAINVGYMFIRIWSD